MLPQNVQKFKDVFKKVQESFGSHLKCCAILEKVYQESNLDEFVDVFIKYLKVLFLDRILVHNPYAQKAIIFCVKLCLTIDKRNNVEDATSPFLVAIFNAVLKLHNAECARYGVCKFINILLREMGENESCLDEEICDKVRDVMFERINDVKASVRLQAVEVLQRFQDPQDTNDIVIKTYMKYLPDNSAQVRRAIVQCIGINMATIPVVLGRCLDIDPSVRLASFDKMSKIPIRALKVEHRQYILRNGFIDKSAKVQQFVESTLLSQWFSNCEENYLKFILALKLDADEHDFEQTIELVERVLEIFFKKHDLPKLMDALPLGNEKLITSGEINWEEFIFWRYIIQFLRTSDRDEETDLVDSIIPELSFFSKYLKKVYQTRSECKNDWEFMHHDYIMMELLKICKGYDLSDEVGRQCLYKVITFIITDAQLSFVNVRLLTEIFEKFFTNTISFAKEICNMVAEIREPMIEQSPTEDIIRKKDVKCAEIRIKIDIALDEQENAIEKEDFIKAEELKLKMTDLQNQLKQINQEFEERAKVRVIKNDVHTLSKCLDLLIAMIMSEHMTAIPEALQAIYVELVEPLLASTNAEIFSRALKLTGHCCIFNKEMAKKSMNLFAGPIIAHKYMPIYDDQTTIIAIDCLTDMVMLHGSDILQSDSSADTTKRTNKNRQLFTGSQIIDDSCVSQVQLQSHLQESSTVTLEIIIETLADLSDDDMPEIQYKSVESIAKLICVGGIRSPMLFTKLVLKWFNPTTVKNQRVRQLIGHFFIIFSHEVRSSLEIIEQSYIPTIKAIMDAPVNSPLADVDVDSVSSFLAILSKPGIHKYNVGLDSHKNLALTLCGEICERPNNKITPVFLRGLLHLSIPSQDEVAICDLRKQVDLMFELVTDKRYHKYLLKYKNKLEEAYEAEALKQNNITNATATTTTTTNNNNTSTEVPVNSSIIEQPIDNNISALRIMNAETPPHPHKDTNENDPKVANTTRRLSVSVKRKKQRNRKSNENDKNGQQTQENEATSDPTNNKNTSTQKVIVTETDSDNTPASMRNKQLKTAVRRSIRKRK